MTTLRYRVAGAVLAAVSVVAAVGAQRARQPVSTAPTAQFKPLIDRYFTAWSTRRPDVAASLYHKGPALVFHDTEQTHVGWVAYRVQAEAGLARFSALQLVPNNDLRVTQRGSVAWTSVTFRGTGFTRDSGAASFEGRHTAVWERTGADWLIVQEHLSVPANVPVAVEPREPTAEDRDAIAALFRAYGEAWTAGDAGRLSELWSEAGDVLSLSSGSVTSGRAEIRKLWEGVIARRGSGFAVQLDARVDQIRFTGPDGAVADGTFDYWSTRGGRAAAPSARERFVALLARTDAGWAIDAARVAEVPRSGR